MDNHVNYLLTKPWPHVGRQPGDRALVRSLFSLYAGPQSMLTAAAQYFYDSLLLDACGEHLLSECTDCLSQTARLHLQKLGQLIVQYGGDPRLLSYYNGSPQWWSGGRLHYTTQPDTILQEAIVGEQERQRACQSLASRMAPIPRALLERIMLDQSHHIDLLEHILHDRMAVPKSSPAVI